MNLEPGKIYGLLGENGVGKTTLLTLLAGLKKPLQGNIDIDGSAPYSRTHRRCWKISSTSLTKCCRFR